MTTITKDIIIKELRDIPDDVASEILDYIQFLKIKKSKEKTLTHFASEESLAKYWLRPEEDEAWKDL